MLLAALVSGIYADGATLGIALAAITTMFVGTFAMFYTRGHKKEVKRKEGYIIVTFGWIVMSVSGMLPYLFTDAIPTVTNAFFETISGYTTTGASILDDIEALPEGVLFWRSSRIGSGVWVSSYWPLPFYHFWVSGVCSSSRRRHRGRVQINCTLEYRIPQRDFG